MPVEEICTATEKELKQMCADIQLLKHRLGEMGLFETMHAMEVSVTKIGWEVAEILKERKKK